MKFNRAILLFFLAATTVLLAAGNGYKLFQQGLAKERAEADLRGAIQIYEQVVQESTADRKLAAQALYRIGECQRALGDAEVRKAYERIVSEYADQKEVVAEAQARLVTLNQPPVSMSIRQIWSGDDVSPDGFPSPDGRYFVFTDWESETIRIRDLRSGQTRTLAGPEALFPIFSPDSREVAYQWNGPEGSSLRLVGADGSSMRVLLNRKQEQDLRPVAWSPDGDQIAVVLSNEDESKQIALVSTADGTATQLKSTGWRRPNVGGFSADGRFLVYSLTDSSSEADDGGIFAIATDGSQETALLRGPANDGGPVWTPDRRAVVFQSDRSGSNALWSIRVAGGKAQGSPELIKENIGDILTIGFDQTGSYYYVTFNRQVDAYSVDVDPERLNAKALPRRLADRFVGSNWGPSWSPDGQFIASFRALDSGRDRAIVIGSVATGEERTLPIRIRQSGYVKGYLNPEWFPDGRSLLVTDTRDSQWTFKRVDIASGDAHVVLRGVNIGHNVTVSPDGKSLYFSVRGEETERGGLMLHLMKKDLQSGAEVELYRSESGGVHFFSIAVSPDGRRVAFMSNDPEDGKRTLYSISAEGGEAKELYRGPPSSTKRTHGKLPLSPYGAEWTKDGRNLLVVSRGQLWAIAAEGGEPQPLNVDMRQILNMREILNPTVSPDDRQVAFTAVRSKGELWVIDNLLPDIEHRDKPTHSASK